VGFAVDYSDGRVALIFYSDRLPPAVCMSFELVLPAALVSAFYIDPFCSESSPGLCSSSISSWFRSYLLVLTELRGVCPYFDLTSLVPAINRKGQFQSKVYL
jgi:hypothetical protein